MLPGRVKRQRGGAEQLTIATVRVFGIIRVVDGLESYIFSSSPNLEVVEFPKSLKRIDPCVFYVCPAMQKAIFHGDAPVADVERPEIGNLFTNADALDKIVVEVEEGSKGWDGQGGTSLPERWPCTLGGCRKNCPIRYIK